MDETDSSNNNSTSYRNRIESLSHRDPRRPLLEARITQSTANQVQELAQNLASSMMSIPPNLAESMPANSSNVLSVENSSGNQCTFSTIEKAMMSKVLSINDVDSSERTRLENFIQIAKEY